MEKELFKINDIVIEVAEFTAEYADCGSHKIRLTLKIDGYDLDEVVKSFNQQIKDITDKPEPSDEKSAA